MFLYDLIPLLNGEPVVIIGHNWMNSYITSILLDLNVCAENFLPQPNCGIRRFKRNGAGFRQEDVGEFVAPSGIDELFDEFM